MMFANRKRQIVFLLATLFALASAISAFAVQPGDPWQTEIDALVAGDTAHPPPPHGVLFIGSSSIRFWTTLTTDFPGIPTINRGFGGSMIADSTRNVSRLVTPYHPNLIVMYAGDNDVAAGHSAARVIDDFKAFVARVRADLPNVPIVYLSIKPSIARAALWPLMREANAGIAQWATSQTRVNFVDVATPMLDANGKPRAELLREDGLHMRPAGYAIWVSALQPVLARYGFVSKSN